MKHIRVLSLAVFCFIFTGNAWAVEWGDKTEFLHAQALIEWAKSSEPPNAKMKEIEENLAQYVKAKDQKELNSLYWEYQQKKAVVRETAQNIRLNGNGQVLLVSDGEKLNVLHIKIREADAVFAKLIRSVISSAPPKTRH